MRTRALISRPSVVKRSTHARAHARTHTHKYTLRKTAPQQVATGVQGCQLRSLKFVAGQSGESVSCAATQRNGYSRYFFMVLWVLHGALGTTWCSGYYMVLWVQSGTLGAIWYSGYYMVLWVLTTQGTPARPPTGSARRRSRSRRTRARH